MDGLHEYRIPTTPEEERLRLVIIGVVKKLLRHRRLDKKAFKFVCKHCSLNIFSILSAKKDISKPEKMIQQRMSKIARLVDEECDKIVNQETNEKAISTEKYIYHQKNSSSKEGNKEITAEKFVHQAENEKALSAVKLEQ